MKTDNYQFLAYAIQVPLLVMAIICLVMAMFGDEPKTSHDLFVLSLVLVGLFAITLATGVNEHESCN